MEGIKSLSTSVLLNPNCKKNRTIPGSICSHCYANTLAQMYSALGARLERNTKELTSRFLTTQDLDYLKKELQNETIFRFEAFGKYLQSIHRYIPFFARRFSPHAQLFFNFIRRRGSVSSAQRF